MSEERRNRIDTLVAQRKYSSALETASEQVTELIGVAVGRDDAVSQEAAASALEAAKTREHSHLLWHRVWGVMLKSEMLDITSRLADLLRDERALLVWPGSPPVGFLVDVRVALRSLPNHLGPRSGERGPGGDVPEILLVTDEGATGLLLAYRHLGDADQYELRSWGRYARSC